MDESQRYCMLQAMLEYGGGFASSLAAGWMRADNSNSARLEAAFPDLVAKYGPGSSFYDAVVKLQENR